jgi:hypothetical protein
MVKVDMGAASSRRHPAPPVPHRYGVVTQGTSFRRRASGVQVRGQTPRVDWEFVMIDRQLIGDVVLAALVAIPAAALARPGGVPQIRTAATSVAAQNSAAALAPAADRQVGIFR